MPQIPDEFFNEFNEKGETFFEIAELLYSNPDRQYTLTELAEEVDRTNTTISNHTGEMVDSEWLRRRENQTTFAWNTDAHNPASTEGTKAAKQFYVDLLDLMEKHSKTLPGVFAMMGFCLILTAIVVFSFFLGFSSDITNDSVIPTGIYLGISFGSFLVGVIVTSFSPLQAILNSFILRVIPSDLFDNE